MQVRAHGTRKGPNRVHTDCLLALLAAYSAACLQLRDKAMKVSDIRGLLPSCKTSSPDVMSVVGDIKMFIQFLRVPYTLQFMLLRLDASAIFTNYHCRIYRSWGKLRGRQHSCAGAGEERAKSLIATMQLLASSLVCAFSCAALKR